MESFTRLIAGLTVIILLIAAIPQTLAQTQTITNVTYCTPNGVNLLMDLYLPISNVTTPIVLEIHGGAWVSGEKSNQWTLDLYPLLNAQGIGLASINYRLAPSWKFPAQIVDSACAVRFLRANAATYNINPSKIGVFGESAGGHLALLLGLTNGTLWPSSGGWDGYPSNVNAVVDWFGPTNLNQHYDFSSQVNTYIYQTFGILPYKLTAASPMTYATNRAPPMLIEHGANDSLVKIHQSQELNAALLATHSFVTVTNAGHSWVQVGPNPVNPSIPQIEQGVADWFASALR